MRRRDDLQLLKNHSDHNDNTSSTSSICKCLKVELLNFSLNIPTNGAFRDNPLHSLECTAYMKKVRV